LSDWFYGDSNLHISKVSQLVYCNEINQQLNLAVPLSIHHLLCQSSH